MESLQKNTLKSVLIIDEIDALHTDSDCCSSFESSSTTSNNSDQESLRMTLCLFLQVTNIFYAQKLFLL